MTARHLTAALAAALATGAAAVPARGAAAPADTRAYGKHCLNQSKRPIAGAKGTPFSRCVVAMGRLARGENRSPRMACASSSRRRAAGTRRSPFDKCVAAGTRLVRYGNGVDRAYLEQMIPHHVAAVEMAQLALTQAQTPYVQTLAQSIIGSQNLEIAQMRTMAARLRTAGVQAVNLELSKAEMGMDHDVSHLDGVQPFDVPFIDMMIPHHQGAITMSKIVFVKGVSPAVRRLARQITEAQALEIRQMRDFRTSVTGSPEPAPDGAGGPHPH